VRKKHPNKNPCTSTASGGALKCVLELDHIGVHSTSTAGRKSGQYATWTVGDDGRVRVVTYSHGKSMSEWFEEPAVQPRRPMTLEDEPADEEADAAAIAVLDAQEVDELHPGEHDWEKSNLVTRSERGAMFDTYRCKACGATSKRHGVAWPPKLDAKQPKKCKSAPAPMELDDQDEDPAPHIPDLKCNAVALHDDEWVCVKPKGHDDEHQSERVFGGSAATWSTVDGVEQGTVRSVVSRGKLGAAIVESWSHPIASKEPSLTDACPKCGREIGEHDGATCPKPYGYVIISRGELLCHDDMLQGGEFRDSDLVGAGGYKAKVFKTKGAATQKAHHLGRITEILPWWGSVEAKRAAEPAPPPTSTLDQLSPPARGWNCMCPGVGDRHMMGDADCQFETNGSVRQSAPSVQALIATAAVGVTEAVSIGHHVRGEGPKILGYRRHPAAALFPLLEGPELAALGDSIAANGLRDPIVRVTVGGETFILDGSNRGVACEQRGIQPRFIDYEGPKDTASLIAYSLDKNGDGRRHLDPSVRAMIVVEASKLMPRGNPGDRETGRSAGLLTQAEAGKRMGVSDRLVRRAKVVRDNATAKVIEAVKKGKLAVDAAEQVSKLSEAKQNEIADEALAKKHGQVRTGRIKALVRQEEKRSIVRKINENRVGPMPTGEFGVIYADYPWKFDNSDQHEGSRGHMPYPPMTLDEIIAHAHLARTRAAKNCVLVLWTTNHHVVTQVGRVVEAYGATQPTTFTWPKSKAGVGSVGRGQTEQLVVAFIGKPVHTLNEISTLLESFKPQHPGEHSSKPAEVAELLLKHCSGPFLELFAREEREGFVCWGAEVGKFAAEAAA
jgi:N6-adenosine-specific RNA methylase IME4